MKRWNRSPVVRWKYSTAAILGAVTGVAYITYLGFTARDTPDISVCAAGVAVQIIFFLGLAWVHNLRAPKQLKN